MMENLKPSSIPPVQSSILSQRRAVIDIGTNSVKLLVADVSEMDVQPVFEGSKQTRLGQGFYETSRLQPEPIAKTAQAVADFEQAARQHGAHTIRVIATSAARDAKNPYDLTAAVEQASGLTVEIISGEQEADMVFHGVTTDPELARHPLLLLDVGGGSTEFIVGHGQHKDFRHSFPLGSVRLLERFPVGDTPSAAELQRMREMIALFLREEVCTRLVTELRQENLIDFAKQGIKLVGTGGAATIMARIQAGMQDFDRERIEAVRLDVDEVSRLCLRLWELPLAARQQVVGLPRKRADVILPGVLIYEAVMREFGFQHLQVSTRGLRYAAVRAGI